VLSAGWLVVADAVVRIGRVTEMEKALPKGAEDATLWEGEELALRYLLEDGKVNLCLRLLDDYLVWQGEAASSSRKLTAEERTKTDGFERGLCQLLANAWVHSEALQTTDLPLLVEVVSTILRRGAADKGAEPLAGRATSLVGRFLGALGKHADKVGEERLLAELVRRRVLELFAVHLRDNNARLAPADRDAGVDGVAAIMATEDFQTRRDEFLADDKAVDDWTALRALLTPLTASDAERRKRLRPLLDFVTLAERRAKKA
jgi:hypothetical protein